MPAGSGADGVKVADFVGSSYEIAPETRPEGPLSVNVELVRVIASIDFEKVARGATAGPTSLTPGYGSGVTVGGSGLAVVKDQDTGDASG